MSGSFTAYGEALLKLGAAEVEIDALRAENLRLRALLHEVRRCGHELIPLDDATWTAICAIDARTKQVPL